MLVLYFLMILEPAQILQWKKQIDLFISYNVKAFECHPSESYEKYFCICHFLAFLTLVQYYQNNSDLFTAVIWNIAKPDAQLPNCAL